ncbi:MAG: hypothetical protein KBH06_07625 [Spirochaetes bacterium]|nr:hypothetical protein [Spirochaetota bacterium]
MIKRILIAILIIHASAAFAETKLYLTGSANAGYAHNPDLESQLNKDENSLDQANYYKIQRNDSNTQYGYSFKPRLFFDDIGLGFFIEKQFLSKAKLSVYNSTNGFWNESYQISAIGLYLELAEHITKHNWM